MKNFGIHFVAKALTAAVLLALFCFSPGVFAEQAETDELSGLSLGDLLNLDVSVATKTEMTMQEAPSIVSVITGDEIRNMGARNITDVLRTVPGFDITHTIEVPNHTPHVRGSGELLTIKMMINSHSFRGTDGQMALLFDMLPVRSIRRIEIIRGPGSALYGTGAFFGVVNIITKEGGDVPSGITLEGGSYGTIKPSGEFSYKDDDFKAYIYADFHTTDGYDGTVESDRATDSPVLGSAAPGKLTSDRKYGNVQANVSFKKLFLFRYDQ